ncbi:MAG: glutathionylspermidine synthase family protein, partial [Polyangiaceae bacterium]
LAPYAILISHDEWAELARTAEALTREMFDAESRIIAQRAALELLSVPRAIRPLLSRLDREATPTLGRIVRFDFHPTSLGWQISEGNSDVPGGFTEASTFSHLMASALSHDVAGSPADAWLDTIAKRAKRVGLLVAPGWPEDMQVVAFLSNALRERGCDAELATPHQIEWTDGIAHVARELDAVVRFHQVEWLARLSATTRWEHYFVGAKTPVGNPGIAIVSESKRFPLACEMLGLSMPTWAQLLPETRELRDAPWRTDDAWILKGAFGNTGDNVLVRSSMSKTAWACAIVHASLSPSAWIAQRRFEASPIDTPDGPRNLCLGIYTVDGVAVGAYARLTPKMKIDFAAVDAAVLLTS